MTTPNGTGKPMDQAHNALNVDRSDELLINSGDRLTIETIADFAQLLRNGLTEAATIVVEFRENVEMDITALQVFCSACQTASAAGKKFIYREPLPTTLTRLATAAGSERHDHCKNDNPACFRKFGGVQ